MSWVALHLLSLSSFQPLSSPHLYLDADASKSYLRSKWKPQFVCGQLVSIADVNSIVNAHVALQSSTCTGSLVSKDDSTMFFIGDNEGDVVSVPHRITLHAVLTRSRSDQLRAFRKLRLWLDGMGVEVNVDMLKEEDRSLWNVSEFDA
jgi:hypothetical protein